MYVNPLPPFGILKIMPPCVASPVLGKKFSKSEFVYIGFSYATTQYGIYVGYRQGCYL